jgi:threonine aldolase
MKSFNADINKFKQPIYQESIIFTSMRIIELRSDTFTKPTAGMLEAMCQAEVGDDVFEEDETTKRLESKCAEMFGYESALFCVSGTMANQIAIAVHTKSGDEVICDSLSHVYLYEGGGIMANAHASVSLIDGDKGRITATQVEEKINPDNVHYPVSKLVSLENTMNKGGGSIYDINEISRIKEVCIKNNMLLHLDGARLFNALVETQESPKLYGSLFDSISICLSKGLGTPMGTVLIGNKNFILQARRVRKRFGGGWRQSGYMAAAGIYALEHQIQRLKEDHRRAKDLGKIFSSISIVKNIYPVETNIVIFTLDEKYQAKDIVNRWMKLGLKTSPFGKHQIRLVTHLDFGDEDLAHSENLLKGWTS